MRHFLKLYSNKFSKKINRLSKKARTNCFPIMRVFRYLYDGRICLPIMKNGPTRKGRARGRLGQRLHFRAWSLGLLSICLYCSLSSCSSYKKITYFKDLSDSGVIYTTGQNIKGVAFQPLLIQPDDILQILISTIDPEANEAFNIHQDNNNTGKNDAMNMPKNLNGYLVDKQGDIELPVLGPFHVVGLTTQQIKDTVLKAASRLLKQPVVNVRLINFTVNVLGEVTRPGSYVITGEKASLLDALGLAGDMTIYGKRDNVILMRTENGVQKKVARFNLNNTDMLNSPYFYLRQGDVIYVEPTKAKAASTDMSATKTYAIAGSVLSVLLIVISRL